MPQFVDAQKERILQNNPLYPISGMLGLSLFWRLICNLFTSIEILHYDRNLTGRKQDSFCQIDDVAVSMYSRYGDDTYWLFS
jgi:hypothetical protein